jgi:predicted TIM-barrel fold metal-dependent hydrolase
MIIDAHCHLGPYGRRVWTATRLIADMDAWKIDRAVVFPTGGHKPTDYSKENDQVLNAVRRHPSRLIGFARVNPHFGSDSVVEVERAVSKGMRGVKLHPTMEVFPANSSLVHPIMEAASRLKVPVLIHTGVPPYALPSQVADVASRFPEVKVIMGHMGGSGLAIDAAPSAKRTENLLLETSGVARRLAIEEAVRSLGAHRVVFGSDWPYSHPGPEITKIRILEITEDERRRVLGGNMAELLGL